MKRFFLTFFFGSAVLLLAHSGGFAQQTEKSDQKDEKKSDKDKLNEFDEIIIRHKSDKDAKVTVEIKDGHVLINGKPVSEFSNDDISVRRKNIKIRDGRTFSFSESGDGDEPATAFAPRPPFRAEGGARSFRAPKGLALDRNAAHLGVSSEKMDDNSGAKVKEVSKGSSAEKAGIKAGDVITKVDEISIKDPQSLFEAIHQYKPEAKVLITYKRDGKEQKVPVVLGKGKALNYNYNYNFNMPDMSELNLGDMNMDLAPLMPGSGYGYAWGNGSRLGIKAQDLEDGKGAKVLDVDDESAAQKAGIKEGDIITRFDGKDVESATALAEAARESKTKSSVKVNVLRDGKPLELEIKTPKKLKTANL